MHNLLELSSLQGFSPTYENRVLGVVPDFLPAREFARKDMASFVGARWDEANIVGGSIVADASDGGTYAMELLTAGTRLHSVNADGEYLVATSTGASCGCWVKLVAHPEDLCGVIGFGRNRGGSGQSIFKYAGICFDDFGRVYASTDGDNNSATYRLAIGKWYYVSANVYTDGSMELFVNGESIGTTATDTHSTYNRLYVGSIPRENGTAYRDGAQSRFDSCRWWSTTHTAAEWKSMYDAGRFQESTPRKGERYSKTVTSPIIRADATPKVTQDSQYHDAMLIDFPTEAGKEYLLMADTAIQSRSPGGNFASTITGRMILTDSEDNQVESREAATGALFSSSDSDITAEAKFMVVVKGDGTTKQYKLRLASYLADHPIWLAAGSKMHVMELPPGCVLLKNEENIESSRNTTEYTISSHDIPDGDWIAASALSVRDFSHNSTNSNVFLRSYDSADALVRTHLQVIIRMPWDVSQMSLFDVPSNSAKFEFRTVASTTSSSKVYQAFHFLLLIPKKAFAEVQTSDGAQPTDHESQITDPIRFPSFYSFSTYQSWYSNAKVTKYFIYGPDERIMRPFTRNASIYDHTHPMSWVNEIPFGFETDSLYLYNSSTAWDAQGNTWNETFLSKMRAFRGLGGESVHECPSFHDLENSIDLSGEANHGTVHADTELVDLLGSGGDRAWQFDRATSSNIDYGSLIETTDTAFTFSCWMRCTDLENFSVFMGQSSTALTDGVGVYVTNDGSLVAYMGNYSSQQVTAPAGTITENEWYHICFTATAVDNATSPDLRLYINGDLVVEDLAHGRAFNLNAFSNYDVILGRAGGYDFSGQIDDFRFFKNKALSTGAVQFLAKKRAIERPEGLGDEVAWWGPSDTEDLIDLSGNGNHAVAVGDPAVETSLWSEDGFQFDGTGGRYIQIPNDDIFNGDAVKTGDFSISLWTKKNINFTTEAIIFRNANSANREGWAVYMHSNEALRIQYGDNSGSEISAGAVTTTGQWHHHAVVVKRTSSEGARNYTDGVGVGYNPDYKEIIDNVKDVFIGDEPGYGGNHDPFDGTIQDIRFFHHALSQSEIKELATSRDVPPLGSEVYHLHTKRCLTYGTDKAVDSVAGLVGTVQGSANRQTFDTYRAIKNDSANADQHFNAGTGVYQHLNGEWEASFWVKLPAQTTERAYLWGSADDVGQYCFCWIEDGTLKFEHNRSGYATGTLTSTDFTALDDDTWHHVTLRAEAVSSGLRFWVDGVQDSGGFTWTADSSFAGATEDFWVASGETGSASQQALVTDLRFYDRLLTKYERRWLGIEPMIAGDDSLFEYEVIEEHTQLNTSDYASPSFSVAENEAVIVTVLDESSSGNLSSINTPTFDGLEMTVLKSAPHSADGAVAYYGVFVLEGVGPRTGVVDVTGFTGSGLNRWIVVTSKINVNNITAIGGHWRNDAVLEFVGRHVGATLVWSSEGNEGSIPMTTGDEQMYNVAQNGYHGQAMSYVNTEPQRGFRGVSQTVGANREGHIGIIGYTYPGYLGGATLQVWNDEAIVNVGEWSGSPTSYDWSIRQYEDDLIVASGVVTNSNHYDDVTIEQVFDTSKYYYLEVNAHNQNGSSLRQKHTSDPVRARIANTVGSELLLLNAKHDNLINGSTTTAGDLSLFGNDGTKNNHEYDIWQPDEEYGGKWAMPYKVAAWDAQERYTTANFGTSGSCSIWFKLDSASALTQGQYGWFWRFQGNNNGSTSPEVGFGMYGAGSGSSDPRVAMSLGSNSAYNGTGGQIAYGEWMHLAFTYTGSSGKVYVNGKLAWSSTRSTPSITNNGWAYIGRNFNEPHFRWDDFRTYAGRELSQAEVYALGEGRDAPALGDEFDWNKPSAHAPHVSGVQPMDAASNGRGYTAHEDTFSGATTRNTTQLVEAGLIDTPFWDFDGSNESIDGDGKESRHEFSVEGFVKYDATAGDQYVLARWGTTDATRNYAVNINSSNQLVFKVIDAAGTPVTHTSVAAIPNTAGEWFHFAACFSHANDLVEIYIDGLLVTSESHGIGLVSDGSTRRYNVAEQYAVTNQLDGKVRNIAVRDRTLHELEALRLTKAIDGEIPKKPVGLGDEVVWLSPEISGAELYTPGMQWYGKDYDGPRWMPNLGDYSDYADWPSTRYDKGVDAIRATEHGTHWNDPVDWLTVQDGTAIAYDLDLAYAFRHSGNTGTYWAVDGLSNGFDPRSEQGTLSAWWRVDASIGTNSNTNVWGAPGSSTLQKYNIQFGDSGGNDRVQFSCGNVVKAIGIGNSYSSGSWFHAIMRTDPSGIYSYKLWMYRNGGTEAYWEGVEHNTSMTPTSSLQASGRGFAVGNINAWGHTAFRWADVRFYRRWITDAEEELLHSKPGYVNTYVEPTVSIQNRRRPFRQRRFTSLTYQPSVYQG